MIPVVVAEGCRAGCSPAGDGKDRPGSDVAERSDRSAGTERAGSGDAVPVERLIEPRT